MKVVAACCIFLLSVASFAQNPADTMDARAVIEPEPPMLGPHFVRGESSEAVKAARHAASLAPGASVSSPDVIWHNGPILPAGALARLCWTSATERRGRSREIGPTSITTQTTTPPTQMKAANSAASTVEPTRNRPELRARSTVRISNFIAQCGSLIAVAGAGAAWLAVPPIAESSFGCSALTWGSFLDFPRMVGETFFR